MLGWTLPSKFLFPDRTPAATRSPWNTIRIDVDEIWEKILHVFTFWNVLLFIARKMREMKYCRSKKKYKQTKIKRQHSCCNEAKARNAGKKKGKIKKKWSRKEVKWYSRDVAAASWYLVYGLHHRLWERPTVAYTGHATIANNLKANGKDKMIVYKRLKISSKSFRSTSVHCAMSTRLLSDTSVVRLYWKAATIHQVIDY